MKQEQPPYSQFALLLAATFLLLWGVWLFATVTEPLLVVNPQAFTFVDAFLLLAVVFILAVVSLFAVWTGIWSKLLKWIKSRWYGPDRDNLPALSSVPMTIALFEYKLDDLEDQKLFNYFLDTPAFSTAPQQIVTPTQLVEQLLLKLAQDVNSKSDGKLIVQPSVARGSLDISLEIVSNAWTFLKEYHDVVSSLLLIGNQTQQITRKITKAYKNKHGRTATVSGGMKVAAKPVAPLNSSGDASAVGPTSMAPPINVTNSYIPPQNNRDLNISLNSTAPHSSNNGCINSCLLFLLLVTLVVFSFLFLFVDYPDRMVLFDTVAMTVSDIIKVVADWLYYIADILAVN